MIASSKLESDVGTTDIYSVLTMVCINSAIDPVKKQPVCALFCGPDLNKPLKTAATVRNKVG
jgi:hypothetical protein